MAEKACHAFASTTRFGLTQALGRMALSTDKLAEELQKKLSRVGRVLGDPPRVPGHRVALVRRMERLKLKMYQEQGHALPHLHIDFGAQHHQASYAIDPATRLEGNLPNKYDRVVVSWISRNKSALLIFWRQLQAGNASEVLLASLQGAG